MSPNPKIDDTFVLLQFSSSKKQYRNKRQELSFCFWRLVCEMRICELVYGVTNAWFVIYASTPLISVRENTQY